MKKVLGIGLVTITIIALTTGCMGAEEKKYAEAEKVMKEYAKDYFDNYAATNGFDVYVVNITLLETANKVGKADYDLTKLEDCKSDSKVMLHLNKDTKKIEKYEYDLKCEF